MTFDPSQIPHVFRARSVQRSAGKRLATGYPELDHALLGGWPVPSLTEVLIDVYGIGELHLLLPLMKQLTEVAPQPPLLVWLNAPHLPNSIAFAQHQVYARHWLARSLSERDLLWATEQALRSNACSMVLAWTSTSNTAALRRLKLAAISCQSVGLLFRPITNLKQPSPANLRIVLKPAEERLSIDIIKNEGRKPTQLSIDVRAANWSGAA